MDSYTSKIKNIKSTIDEIRDDIEVMKFVGIIFYFNSLEE
jgi:chaperonin cofactor prefoldin